MEPKRKVGRPPGKYDGYYDKRIHDVPLTKEEIKGYRKNLKDPDYIEVATEGAAMKMAGILMMMISKDIRDGIV